MLFSYIEPSIIDKSDKLNPWDLQTQRGAALDPWHGSWIIGAGWTWVSCCWFRQILDTGYLIFWYILIQSILWLLYSWHISDTLRNISRLLWPENISQRQELNHHGPSKGVSGISCPRCFPLFRFLNLGNNGNILWKQSISQFVISIIFQWIGRKILTRNKWCSNEHMVFPR